MGSLLKTTIEMSDPLFKSAKELAQRSQTTLRALIEEGLRRVISDSQVKAKSAFKLKDASVGGKAVLLPEPARWQQLEEVMSLAESLTESLTEYHHAKQSPWHDCGGHQHLGVCASKGLRVSRRSSCMHGGLG